MLYAWERSETLAIYLSKDSEERDNLQDLGVNGG
jgi:hypothetical protein